MAARFKKINSPAETDTEQPAHPFIPLHSAAWQQVEPATHMKQCHFFYRYHRPGEECLSIATRAVFLSGKTV